MSLVLSLFPGIGLLDMAFEEEGFCVVRGPDLLWGGDIRRFHPPAGKFDGVIGGPPCQAFSRLRHLVEHNGYRVAENLIPEFERCLHEARPTRRRAFWYWGPGRFEIETLALHRPDPEFPVLASGGAVPVPVAIGGSGKVKRTARAIATRKGTAAAGFKTQAYYATALAVSGLPADFLAESPFTMAGKIKVVGNGVPPAMGRAVALAVKRALTTPGPGAEGAPR